MHLGVNVDEKDQRRATALHAAVCGTQPGAIKLLAAAGADLEAQDEFGITPLALACLSLRQDNTMAEILVDQGANVHSVFSDNGRFASRFTNCWSDRFYKAFVETVHVSKSFDSLQSRIFTTPLLPKL